MLCFFVVGRVFSYEFTLFILTTTLGGNISGDNSPHFPDHVRTLRLREMSRLRPDITTWEKLPGNYEGVSRTSWVEPEPADNTVSFYEVSQYPPAFVSLGIYLL